MTHMSFDAGIYSADKIPMASYVEDQLRDAPTLNCGCALRLIEESPLHAWSFHPRLGGRPHDHSRTADTGTTAHDMLLGGEGKICEIDPRDYPSKEGATPIGWTNPSIRAARDEARANSLTPMLKNELVGVRAMVRAARQFIQEEAGSDSPEIRERMRRVFDTGESETTLIWQEGGTWFRARPDWMNYEQRVMLHYKTTMTSAKPESFMRGVMESMGYDFMLAFYRRGLESLTEQRDWLHVILVQEQQHPNACSVISLDSMKWAVADDKVSAAIDVWRSCLLSGKWPAYSGCINYAQPRPWELAELEVSYA